MELLEFENLKSLEDIKKWYIKNRLENQINWYDTKSVWNQKWFKRIKKIEIVLASTITFLALFLSNYEWVRYIIALNGVMISILSGINSLYNFHKNWVEYRTTAETLKHEKFLYFTKSGPYSGLNETEAFQRFVERVESLISKENTRWLMFTKKIVDELNKIQKGGI